MATEVERLVVSLEASITKYERAMQRAVGHSDRTARRIEGRFQKMAANANASLGKVLAPLAGAAGLRAAQQLLDTSTRIQNALRVTGLEGEALTRVYDQLYAAAQQNAAPLESLVTLYGRAALVQKELGVSTEELLGFTENVALALRVSGQSAAEASGALLQLSQALGGGVVRAEEFNSILEGAPTIAQAAAAGLAEAGGSVSRLRTLVTEGKVSSEAFFRAFEAGAPMLQQRAKSTELTFSQAMEQISNRLIDAAGRINAATGASAAFADQVNSLADAIERITNNPNLAWVADVFAQINGLGNSMFEGTIRELEQIGQLIDMIGGGTGSAKSAIPSGPTGRGGRRGSAGGAAIKPVSLSNFAAPDGSGAVKLDDYQRAVKAMQERTDAVRAEAAAMSQLNPLINDYGYAIEKARAEHELYTAAMEAGIPIDQELRDQIAQIASQYALMGSELEKVVEKQAEARESMTEWFDLGRSAARGFIDDLVAGKDAAEALGNVFSQLSSKFLDLGLNALFGTGSGANPFGAIGSLLGIPGRASGGPVRAGQPYVVGEKRPELFVPSQNGTIIPRLPTAAAGGGQSRVVVELGAGLEARILQQAADQSIQINQAMTPKMVDRRAPTAVAQSQRNRMI
ncbi:MAG: tape measure protein [Devosia sp.]